MGSAVKGLNAAFDNSWIFWLRSICNDVAHVVVAVILGSIVGVRLVLCAKTAD